MTYPPPYPPPVPPAPYPGPYGQPGQPGPRKRRVWPWIAGGVVLLLVIIGACSPSARSTSSSSTPYRGPAGATTASAAGSPAAGAGKTTPSPAAAAPAPAPAAAGPLTTFGDGTYEVGVDVAAGRYKTPGSGQPGIWGSCYWERSRDDSGGFSSIIANENLQGPGSVSLKRGEFFKTNGGCQWTKQ